MTGCHCSTIGRDKACFALRRISMILFLPTNTEVLRLFNLSPLLKVNLNSHLPCFQKAINNERSTFSNLFCHFTYITAHSPTLPSLYLRHSSISNPSVDSPTSQFILQPFFRFSYVTSSLLNSPVEPPMSLYVCVCVCVCVCVSVWAGITGERLNRFP